MAPPFLTLALVGGQWSALRPCLFTPGEIAPGTHWIGGWLGLRAGLDAVKKKKYLDSVGNRTPALQFVARFSTDRAVQVSTFWNVSHSRRL
jgi:hypothetical protein